jgi:hypothetical protein
MEAKDLGRPAAVGGLDLLPASPTEALEDGCGLGEVSGGPEPAPASAPDVPLRLGSAMNVRPLSRLTSRSSRDSSASTIRSLAARISRLGAPPLFPADFFTITIHLLAFSRGI